MTSATRIGIVGTVVLLGVVATSAGATPKPEAETVVNDKQFHDQLLAAAHQYRGFGRVDDEMRWAPFLCRMPLPGQARFSKSSDEATHGRKLYSMFAQDRSAYREAPEKASATGQIIVKESWLPEEVKDLKTVQDIRDFRGGSPVEGPPRDNPRRKDIDDEQPRNSPSRKQLRALELALDHFYPYAVRDGKTYKASKKGDLFIMMKLDPKTAGTDNGWVYGTVTADGKTVTSAGKVASCMKCHETKPERLFGLNGDVEKKGK